MTVIFMESFDGVSTITQLAGSAAGSTTTKWFEHTRTPTTDWVFSSSKLKVNAAATGVNFMTSVGSLTTVVFGFKWTPAQIDGTVRAVCTAANSAINKAALFLTQFNGELEVAVTNGSGVYSPQVDSSGLGLTTGVEYAIEVKYVRTGSSTWTVTVKVDGVVVITAVGLVAGLFSAFDAIAYLALGDHSTLVTNALNDLYDAAYIDSADFLAGGGAWSIQCIRPDGAGAHTDWVPDSGANYARVNEQNVDDAGYVQATNDGDEDTYTYGNPTPVSSHSVRAIQVNSRAAYLSGAKNLAHIIRDGSGTEGQGADKALSASLGYVGTVFNKQADGTTNWGSFTDLNSYQVGRKQRA